VAVILTLLLHGLLLLLFDYKEPKKVYSNTRSAGITFMNLTNQTALEQKELLNWLEYHEPSLISAPNTTHGYNQLNPHINFRAAQPDKIYQTVLPKSSKNKLKEFVSLGIHTESKNDLAKNVIFNSPGQVSSLPEKPTVKLPELKYPLIKSNNTVLKLAFSPYLLKDSEKLKAKSMLINYNLEKSKLLPRVVIIDSSGNRGFDMSVLRELSLCIDDIAQEQKDFAISIQWRKEVQK